MARTRLQAVGEEPIPNLIGEEIPRPPPQPQPTAERAFTNLLLVSLRALSQRTIVAIGNLVDGALLASAFTLWTLIIRDPSSLQLWAVGSYACFCLIALWLRRRGIE